MGVGRGEPIWGAGPEGLPRLTVGSRLRRLAGGQTETAFCPVHELELEKQGRLGSGLDQGQGSGTVMYREFELGLRDYIEFFR